MYLARVKDGYVAGIAGGLAKRYALDPTAVRLAWLVAVLAGGVGLGAYLLLWWLMPKEGREPVEPPHPGHLRRAVVDRKVGGVFGGIAQHYGWDPTVARALGLLLIPCSVGMFFLAYVIAIMVIPPMSPMQAKYEFP